MNNNTKNKQQLRPTRIRVKTKNNTGCVEKVQIVQKVQGKFKSDIATKRHGKIVNKKKNV